MKRIVLALLTVTVLGTAAQAQYGGPPMWPRDRRIYEPRGPQMDPCIRYGDCRGPRPEPRWPRGMEGYPPRMPPGPPPPGWDD